MTTTATPLLSNYSGSLVVFSGIFVVTYLTLRSLTVSSSSRSKGRRLPPSMPSVPLLGSMPFLPDFNQLPAFLTKTAERLGPVYSLMQGSVYTVILNSRETIHEAFVKNSTTFAGRDAGYVISNFVNPNQRGIIFKQYGPDFRKYHQWTLSVLREFGFGSNLMEERIMTEADELLTLLKKHNGQPMYPGPLFSACTLNIIASIAFGKKLSQEDESLYQLAKNFHETVTNKSRLVDFCPPLRFLPKFKKLIQDVLRLQCDQYKFIDDGIYRSLSLDADESFVKSFSDRYKDSYDPKELRSILRDLLLAGSETTATTLQWAMIYMANNRNLQERLQCEIDSVCLDRRQVTMQDMSDLKLVEATILEIMRVKTVAPFGVPHLTLEDAEVGGYFIPKGTKIISNLYAAHFNPADWDQPDEFKPERFLDESGNVTGKDRVISFSLGKRSCLGEFLARQELFLFFTTLVQNFHILPPEGQDRVEYKTLILGTVSPLPYDLRLVERK